MLSVRYERDRPACDDTVSARFPPKTLYIMLFNWLWQSIRPCGGHASTLQRFEGRSTGNPSRPLWGPQGRWSISGAGVSQKPQDPVFLSERRKPRQAPISLSRFQFWWCCLVLSYLKLYFLFFKCHEGAGENCSHILNCECYWSNPLPLIQTLGFLW